MLRKFRLWLFRKFCDDIIQRTETAINYIRLNNMQNDQWVLDWIDKLNKLSVEL